MDPIHSKLGSPSSDANANASANANANVIADLEHKISRLSARCTLLEKDREIARSTIAYYYQQTTGNAPVWSNNFGYKEACLAIFTRTQAPSPYMAPAPELTRPVSPQPRPNLTPVHVRAPRIEGVHTPAPYPREQVSNFSTLNVDIDPNDDINCLLDEPLVPR